MEHTENTQTEYNYGNKHGLKQIFVEKLRASGLITSSCKESGISRSTFHRWVKTDGKFAQEVNNAMTEAYGKLKDQLKTIPVHKRSSCLIACMKAAGDFVYTPKIVSSKPAKRVGTMSVVSPAFVLRSKQAGLLTEAVEIQGDIIDTIKEKGVESMTVKELINALPKVVDAVVKMLNSSRVMGMGRLINTNGSAGEMEEQMLAMVGAGREY